MIMFAKYLVIFTIIIIQELIIDIILYSYLRHQM